MRRHTTRISTLTAGAAAAVVILAVCYLVFGGSVPFTGSAFVLKATFTVETNLHLDSPVRIAGVDVGQVTSVKRISGSPTDAVVSMAIQPNGLPIHADATLNIRPRLFLEGNYYVDLAPGTPSAPTLSSDATLPAANTSGPVQLDRVLDALNSNARANLQTLVQGLGASLNVAPTRAQDASQDPTQRGLTAGQSLNASLKYAANAFKASAIVDQALLGTRPHDLSGVVSGSAHVFSALASEQSRLADLVTTFDATMGALAARQQDLSTTISLLPPLLRSQAAALGPLQASFGPTRAFARELTPSVEQLAPTITAGLPWIAQATALFSPAYLGGLLSSLAPAVASTTSALSSTKTLLSGSDGLARCLVHNVIPTGNQLIQDPPVTTGLRVYQELFQSAVGLAGAGQNFDGNGRYLRATAGGGSDREATGSLPAAGPLYGNAVLPTLGTRPAFPGHAPPLRRDVPCFDNAAPNLNAVRTGTGP
jgi:phospholipid/cholesterol/gamma-HCH transport system substrate-binding protein